MHLNAAISLPRGEAGTTVDMILLNQLMVPVNPLIVSEDRLSKSYSKMSPIHHTHTHTHSLTADCHLNPGLLSHHKHTLGLIACSQYELSGASLCLGVE